MRVGVLTTVMLLAAAGAARAQSVKEEIRAGDRAYDALDLTTALDRYEKAIAAEPKNYEALWKASRTSIDLGLPASTARRNALFSSAEQYARRAVAANPGDAEGHFVLAWALGRTALSQSPRGRVKYGTEVRSQALECLRLNPAHAGCLHIMGMWNAEIMRLNAVVRLIARNVLGGRAFGSASWKEAVRYMEAAVATDPKRIVHRLDMGEIYRDVGEKQKARQQFETGLRLPATDFNDARFKAEIRHHLERLGAQAAVLFRWNPRVALRPLPFDHLLLLLPVTLEVMPPSNCCSSTKLASELVPGSVPSSQMTDAVPDAVAGVLAG